MNPIFRYFWALMIAMTWANAYSLWMSSRADRKSHPDRQESYQSLIRGFGFWGSVPWVVMGMGILTGQADSILDYMNPSGRPWLVHAWFGSIGLLWVLGTNWLFRLDGAQTIRRHPGLVGGQALSPALLKLMWAFSIVSGLIAMGFAYFVGAPVPQP